ncbi:MAG: branched-chain amino acid permease [Chloroflexi bacterium]|nr:MAG: branched-chain amino acid permease [Chloroflexota bacterium]
MRRTLLAAAPIAVAVGVFGMSFGVLARQVHIPGWAAVLMSALVFAGSAQFAAIAILGAGGGVVAAVLAGALLNLRYLAVGAAVAQVLPGGPLRRVLLGQLVVDESYVLGVAAGEAGRPDARTVLTTGALLYGCWVLGTIVGVLLGPLFGDPKRLGLDAAFPALFVALLWPMLTTRRAIRAAVAGGAAGLILAPFTPPGVPLAVAAAVGLLVSQ